jgi:hypothetical protein
MQLRSRPPGVAWILSRELRSSLTEVRMHAAQYAFRYSQGRIAPFAAANRWPRDADNPALIAKDVTSEVLANAPHFRYFGYRIVPFVIHGYSLSPARRAV